MPIKKEQEVKLSLVRYSYQKTYTLGIFFINEKYFCDSLELPFLNNSKNISCIPEGVYECTPEMHSKFGLVIRLHNVPEREGILIHAGNNSKDTKGCILLGVKAGNAVSDSKITLRALLSLVRQNAVLKINTLGTP